MNDDLRELEYLTRNDDLHPVAGVEGPAFIHRDHRWILVLIAWAQARGYVPKPSTLVMFDRHSDAAPTIARDSQEGLQALRRCRKDGAVADFISLCENHLTKNDGDWLKAGMDAGLLGDAVIFGAHEYIRDGQSCYEDIDGEKHGLWVLSHVSDELAYQGKLTDRAYTSHYKKIWETLDWDPGRFMTGSPPWVHDFDLDYFAVNETNLGAVFPWPEKVYRSQFLEPCTARYVEGWTARMFMDGLLERCGLLTIAREPDYCGGESDCEQIFADVNKFLFDGKLSVRNP